VKQLDAVRQHVLEVKLRTCFQAQPASSTVIFDKPIQYASMAE
jgi:hypothetical protein